MADTKNFPTGNNIIPKSNDRILITDTSDGNEMKDVLISDLTAVIKTGHTHDDRYYTETEIDAAYVKRITGVTTGFTITEKNTTVLANASGNTITITLPSITGTTGDIHYVKVVDDTFTVTVVGYNSEEIDGESSIEMNIEGETLGFQSDGTSWYII